MGSVSGMKLCISTLACPAWTLEQIIETTAANEIAGIDFRGIGPEIDISKLPAFNEELPTTLENLHRHNLTMPCLNTSVAVVAPAPERWEMMLEECRRYASLAEKTHTRFLRVFGGAVPKGMTREEARLLGQRHLRQLMKITHAFGCRILLETHDSWATSAQVLELIHEFDPADVGVLWDVEHPYRRGEAMLDTAVGLGKYLAHIHVKDSVPADGKSIPKLLGEGDLPLRDFVAALKHVGYDGWICLECEKRWHAEAPEPEASIPQFAAYIWELWGAA